MAGAAWRNVRQVRTDVHRSFALMSQHPVFSTSNDFTNLSSCLSIHVHLGVIAAALLVACAVVSAKINSSFL